MRLTDYFPQKFIVSELLNSDKIGSIKELIDVLHAGGKLSDSIDTFQKVMERESLESTAVADGVAFPHAQCESLEEVVCAMGISRKGVEFASPDAKPVHLIFLSLYPPKAFAEYMSVLASIAKIASDKGLKGNLLKASSAQEIARILSSRSKTFG